MLAPGYLTKWFLSKEPVEYLKHIRDESLYILSITGKGISREEFLNDETLKRAVVRSPEIIGEAAKRIAADFKIKWNNVKWKEMAGMRDRLIHDYMGVNYSIVWDVIINKIPELSAQVVIVIENE
jgi:uncharacterized protein with HEPN domain